MIFGLGKLFGGGESAQTPKQLGYETPEGLQFLQNYLQNDSKFADMNSAFRDGLNSTIGSDVGRNIVQNSFSPQMSRFGSDEEISYLYDAAERAGATNNANELRNFTSQFLAMTPAGQEQDMTPYYGNQGYLGATVRNEDGTYGGQRVFGDNEEMYTKAKNLIATSTDVAEGYLARLGARGGFT